MVKFFLQSMHYFDKVPTEPQLYILEGDPHILKEFTSYLLVKRTPSLILDGGNSFNPFTISFFCRKLNIDAMEQIFVSRAFTVFQLKILITQNLPAFIQEKNPSIVFVSFFSDLFRSDDVEEKIRTILYKKLLLRLKEIVNTYDIPVMVTDRKNTSHVFDCRVSFRMKRNAVLLSIDGKKHQVPLIPLTQKTLDCWRDSRG
jgi:hypothetical protein